MSKIRWHWDEELSQVIQIHFAKGYTWEDYQRGIDDLIEASAGKTIHLIMIYGDEVLLPKTAPTPHQQRALRKLKIGVIAYITKNRAQMQLITASAKVLDRYDGIDHAFVADIEAARVKILELIKGYEERQADSV